MSELLAHLDSGWAVDQAIVTETERVVLIRFGSDDDLDCMIQDEILYKISEQVRKFAIIYLVDITQVPDFNNMYELVDSMTLMFFFKNKHILIDLGTGDNNKVTTPIENKQELIDLIETVYRGATKGQGLVTSLKDYSTSQRY